MSRCGTSDPAVRLGASRSVSKPEGAIAREEIWRSRPKLVGMARARPRIPRRRVPERPGGEKHTGLHRVSTDNNLSARILTAHDRARPRAVSSGRSYGYACASGHFDGMFFFWHSDRIELLLHFRPDAI
jgi:hypothetical protein